MSVWYLVFGVSFSVYGVCRFLFGVAGLTVADLKFPDQTPIIKYYTLNTKY